MEIPIPFYWLKNEGNVFKTVQEHYKRLTPLNNGIISYLIEEQFNYVDSFDLIGHDSNNIQRLLLIKEESFQRVRNNWIDHYIEYLGYDIDNELFSLGFERWFDEMKLKDFFQENPGFLLYAVYFFDRSMIFNKESYVQAYWPFPKYDDESKYQEENIKNKIMMEKTLQFIPQSFANPPNEKNSLALDAMHRRMRDRYILEYLIDLFDKEEEYAKQFEIDITNSDQVTQIKHQGMNNDIESLIHHKYPPFGYTNHDWNNIGWQKQVEIYAKGAREDMDRSPTWWKGKFRSEFNKGSSIQLDRYRKKLKISLKDFAINGLAFYKNQDRTI